MESEPFVNAVGVEVVVATREKTKRLLVVVELCDADSALERPLSNLKVHGCRILEGRELRDDGGDEPPCSTAGPEAAAGGSDAAAGDVDVKDGQAEEGGYDG